MTTPDTPDFDLVVTAGKRFVLFHKDVGVWLGGESIGFMQRGERVNRPFRDIASVTLTRHGLLRVGIVAHCDIRFRSGERAIIANVNNHGFADGVRSEIFRDFAAAFHRRLVAAGTGDIVFRSGYGATRSIVLLFALIAGALLFLVLPIVLFLRTGDAGTLVLLVGGLVLLLPAFRIFGPNRPTAYAPERPPDLLARSTT